MSDARASHPSLAAWQALRDSGARRGALVTLIRADGGAARALGTRLTLSDDGRAFGAVTVGGCADGRAREAARRTLESGTAERVTIPLSEADALALGLGCAGDIDLLVESVTLDADDAIAVALDAAVSACARGEPSVLATPLDGARGRLVVSGTGTVAGTTGDASRDRAGVEMALDVLRDSRAVSGLRDAGGISWFVERIAPARALIIVGATELAAALCSFASLLGWHAVLLDSRDELLAQSRFAAAGERVGCIPAEVVLQRLAIAPEAAVVVVAHDYRVELPVLRAALSSTAPYVGMLGSRKRGAAMREMLAADGVSERDVARLRTPIGLSIGAEGAAEIAVSIVAEIIATWRGTAALQ